MNEEDLSGDRDEASGDVSHETEPPWEALCEGSLRPEEEAALRALAAATSPDALAAFEAYRPLDDAWQERVTDRILASLAARDADAAEAPPESARRVRALPEPMPEAAPEAMPEAVQVAAREAAAPRPPGRLARWTTAVAALGAAAAVALCVGTMSPAPPAPQAFARYSLEAIGGEQTARGAPAARGPAGDAKVRTLGPGSRFELLLRPDAAVVGEVAIAGFLVRGGRTTPYAPTVERDPSGAARVQGTRDSLFAGVPAGPVEVVFLVGPPGSLPDSEGAIREALAGPPAAADAFQVLRTTIHLLDATPEVDPRSEGTP